MVIASILIRVINIAAQVLSLLVIAKVIISYFMSPYHPVRSMIDRLVDPMLMPIRRVVPAVSMIDFSPLILLILIELVSWLLTQIIIGFIR